MSLRPYYEHGGICLYLGDAREVLPTLTAGCADFILTDPPYAAAAATVTTGRARTKWGGNWGDMSLVTLMARMTYDNPCIAPVHQSFWFCDPLSHAALVPFFFSRYPTIQTIVWDKDILGLGACYRKQTELILYARTENAPLMAKDYRDLIRLRPNYASKQHPAEKPLPLILQLAAATKWATLLDPYAGAGTALVAAQQLGRRAIGIEIEEPYCELIARRLSQEVLPLEAAI